VATATNDIVVMKFGGTSVASAEDIRRAAQRIVAARERETRVVAVLSARGKTTDELVAMAREVSDRPNVREMDMLLSTGERISCALCAMAISDMGHEAISLTGSQAGIVTDSSHTKARILDVRADRIRDALEQDKIVLVAGFQGVSGDSRDVTTLGRGGSDTTAIAIAAALGADLCEIYTDVAGVFSADPRIVPDARKLKMVSFDEMLEMSSSGAGVLQLRAVEYARNHGVRVHCRSSFDDGPGTLVLAEDETMERPMVTAVTHAYEARVTLTGLRDEPGVAGRVFGALADANVNVDMIIQNEPVSDDQKADLSFTVVSDDLQTATDVLSPLDIGEGIETDDRVGKVSIVGAGMRSHPGVAAKVFRTLGEKEINIEMISTSPIKISCVIAAEQVPDAVGAIHEAFELGAEAVREEDPSGEHRPRVTS
jgi:aspartate kinase